MARAQQAPGKGGRKSGASAPGRDAGKAHRPGRPRTVRANDLAGAAEGPLPRWLPPALATLTDRPPDGDGWLHEIKLDGYRILARTDAGKATLLSRNAKDWTATFSRIATALADLPLRDAFFDGEVVALRPDGTTSFQDVQNALGRSSQQGLVYCVFDLLHLDGVDLTGCTLEDRKRALAALLESGAGGDLVRYSDHVVGRGGSFYRQACRHALEGIVSKRRDVAWRSGRTGDWCKTKCLQGQEFVIGGFTDGEGSRTGFGALLLGVHEGGSLRYCGRVGTGFSETTLRQLSSRLKALERDDMPFASVPPAARRGVHWTDPALVCEVAFLGWTRDGLLRHPSFRGLRDDRPASEVTLDRAAPPPHEAAAAPSAEPDPEPEPAREAPGERAPRVLGVRIGNASKVFYPGSGVTKLEIARYYEAVAPFMPAHAALRPLTLLRCPNGIDGECFFQKTAEGAAEEGLGRVRIPEASDGNDSTYLYAKDASGFVSLLQMGVLEVHIWGSKAAALEKPDRIVFDLDPGPGVDWDAVLHAARLVRSTLQRLGLESLVMTTGGKGLHVVVPVLAELEWPAVKSFTRSLVQAVMRLEPGRYTAALSKQKRDGVIFIDWLRNGRGSTAVAPYSTRARPGAPVAVPLAWDELTAKLRPDAFTVRNLARRLRSRKKDPWQEAALAPQSLAKVLEAARSAR